MAVLKFTSVLYGTPAHSSRNKVMLFLKVYTIAVFLYMLILSFGLRVVSISIGNAKDIFPQNYTEGLERVKKKIDQNTSVIKNQKVLIIPTAYGLRFFDGRWFIQFGKPELGDYVLVKENNTPIDDIPLLTQSLHVAKYITNILSFGIVQFYSKKQLFIVDAVGPSRVKFSRRYGIEKDTNIQFVDIKDLENHPPILAQSQLMDLGENEVFLSDTKEYQLDSRFLGAFNVRHIFGKAVFFVGPVWMPIKSKR